MSGADEIRDAASWAVDPDHLNLAVRIDDLELRTLDNQDAIAALIDIVASYLGISPDEIREELDNRLEISRKARYITS